MTLRWHRLIWLLLAAGCATGDRPAAMHAQRAVYPRTWADRSSRDLAWDTRTDDAKNSRAVQPAAYAEPDEQPAAKAERAEEPKKLGRTGPILPDAPAPSNPDGSRPADDMRGVQGSANGIELDEVLASVRETFPLLAAAALERNIADGNQIAAWGEFDTKLKASSENGPTSFYKTYRHGAGLNQPIYHGGEVFGGYRIGRGFFEPWYQERQTNDGGEFKAGFRVPLWRNRDIDARRAALWRAVYDRERVDPEVQAQLIFFMQDASFAYWKWVAAGGQYEVGRRALDLAIERNEKLKRRLKLGDIGPPVVKDNQRSIAKREAKLFDLERKLQQAAVKLSLFYRTATGAPVVLPRDELPSFPEPVAFGESQLDSDIQLALSQRPELPALDALMRRINVDLAEAENNFLPNLDSQIVTSQDVGRPTSSKRDKSRFELEASLFLDVPLQRRKARGKSLASQAKLSQLSAKRRFTQDKIVAEVQSAFAGVQAAFERVGKAREARRLAEELAAIERRKIELGGSDLLSVILREQFAIEAAIDEIDALLAYFMARADYAAALAAEAWR